MDPEKVIVMWKDGHGGFGILSYRDGPRVYNKDETDGRSGKLPYFSTLEELVEKQEPGSNHAAQLPLEEAKKHGLI